MVLNGHKFGVANIVVLQSANRLRQHTELEAPHCLSRAVFERMHTGGTAPPQDEKEVTDMSYVLSYSLCSRRLCIRYHEVREIILGAVLEKRQRE